MTDAAAPLPRRTRASNSAASYGWVERAFHWSIALLIPTAAVLGVVAYEWPYDTDAQLGVKAALFSWHKTVGITVFAVALARILWALTQPRPVPLHPQRRLETFAASTVHWLLYGALVAVPLTGWIHHATAEGFAPILWPFGQSLPFLPKDAALSAVFSVLHRAALIVLGAALALHVAGAFKHLLIDRDAVFARMWRGVEPAFPPAAGGGHLLPMAAAALVWLAALSAGWAVAGAGSAEAPPVARAETAAEAPAGTPAEATFAPNWAVEEGTLSITVAQLGQEVTGSFGNWDALIDFEPEPRPDLYPGGALGRVEVSVDTGSLTLGSVSDQATGEEFLNSGAFPTAVFAADIEAEGEGYVADGTLSLRGVELPVRLPFTLSLDGENAAMAGAVEVDRRDFGMGTAYGDESTVGFGVTIDAELTARRTQ